MIAICTGLELLLLAADLRLIGSPLWRSIAYQNGAFWPGLLGNWRPNYALQPVTMFLSYAFLHGGMGHLLGNMITLWALGRIVVDRVGASGFLWIYSVAAIFGALTYALVLPSPFPMVGASGGLFGLAGAWQYWIYADSSRNRWWIALRAVIGLIVLNLALLWYLEGRMAWQSHLGGFIAGWGIAAILNWIRRDRSIARADATPPETPAGTPED